MSDEREIIAKGKTLLIRPRTEDEDAGFVPVLDGGNEAQG
jgi:hypothetical protein